jgi:DNA polymerase-1
MPLTPPTDTSPVYIIDGHAQIFRAYYAIRSGLTSPVTGEPTNAIFAYASMMLKLLGTYQPTFAVMAIDMPGKTFRDDLYDKYKATRNAPPEDLIAQIPRILEVTRLFGVPVLGHQGAEADDVIATLARRVLADPQFSGRPVRIVSKDKDLQQLITDRVTLFDIQTDITLDATALMADLGITPEQVVDLLTFTGDTADNIPGVPGVGPKTASLLLNEFGTLDNVFANLDKIKGKRRESLEASREIVKLARSLVMLKHDLPLDASPEAMRIKPPEAAALKQLFQTLGFHRHQTDLDRLVGAPKSSGAAPPSLPIQPGAQPAKPMLKRSNAPIGLFDGLGGDEETEEETQPYIPPTPARNSSAVTSSLFDSTSKTGENAADLELSTADQFDYRPILTREDMDAMITEIRALPKGAYLAIDTETIGLSHAAAPCGISLAWKPGHGVYIPLKSPTPERHLAPDVALALLKPVLEDAKLKKCGHNLKYDILVLRHAGIAVRGVAFDSMIASHMTGVTSSHGLDHLALNLLKHRMIPITDLIGESVGRAKRNNDDAPGETRAGLLPDDAGQTTMDRVPIEAIATYAAEDADMALRLTHSLEQSLEEKNMGALARNVEMPLVEVLADMEFVGVRVDPEVLKKQKHALADRIMEIHSLVQEKAGTDFNPDSPKQLADVLFKRLKLPVIRRNRTGPSTDVEVLETLADREDVPPEKAIVCSLIVEYRQLTKLVNTYLDNLREEISPRDNRIHASFHQTGAATGRLSSSNPNLQNIPIRTEIGRLIRKAFIAEPGCKIISADYSQIELRMLAHMSQDPGLLAAFERDDDIHEAVAAQVFGVPQDQVTREQRGHAKMINFGIIYGVTPYGLSRRVEGLNVEGAKRLIADYKKRFAGIDRFLQTCIRQALDEGYVTTILGRRRSIREISSHVQTQRSLGERLAINSVIQGSAADLIKLAMVNLHRRIMREDLPMKMTLQIHDELVFESPDEHAEKMAATVKHEMETAMKLIVPLKADAGIGENWLEAK